MADVATLVDQLSALTVLEAANLVKQLEEKWGVSAAAPVAVALATGLHASRIDGSALKYNEADPKLPDLVVCRKDLAPRLLAALQRHLPSE